MALGRYTVKLAVGGFILPFYFLFNPGLNMQGGVLYILQCVAFAIAMCTFASYAMQGYFGLRLIGWLPRVLLMGCAVAAIVPRLDVQIAATVVGSVILALKYLRGRPAKVDVPA
jgi:TRAP-type uncharacterized transport system fused permease subunit